MRKYIKIFGVIIFVYCCLGIFNIAKAEHDTTPEGDLYEQPGMVKKPVPVYCGPTEFMLNAATTQFNQEPLVVGKVIIPQTGEVVAMVTVFIHNDHQFDMSVLMTMLTRDETCVLAYGKELDWYTPKSDSNYRGSFTPVSTYGGLY